MTQPYETEFLIIASAGEARSAALLALSASREGDAEKASELLAEAERNLLEAHHVQTAMIQSEARGESVPVSILTVHAQDHFSGAQVIISLAKELIHVHEALRAVTPEGALS